MGRQAQGLHHPSSPSFITTSSSSHGVPKNFRLEEEWDELTGWGDSEAAVGPQRCSTTLLSGKNTFLSMCL